MLKRFVLVPLLVASPALATNISGTLSGTLSISGSPYIATANINVPVGQTLTIDPGVVIKMSGGTWPMGHFPIQ